MTTALAFKDFIDLPMWRPESPALANSSSGSGFAFDGQNNAERNPFMFYLRSATAFDLYNPLLGEWLSLASPALTGTFGAGASCIFHPSQGPRGTIAAGATTTSVVLSTALPSAVGVNQLANRGDGVGFKVRIVDNASGASGKTETKTIIGNTGGTTPTLTLDSALSFTPTTGSRYEIMSGRVFLLSAGTLAAGMWKYYDIATNSFSGNLATTNLPATVQVDSSLVALSEVHVSSDRSPGTGFVSGGATYDGAAKNCILATASSGTTITGSGMPADLQTNEYRNFQVRVVEDTTTPTAVGQRSRIASHTSGAAGVFTVATWGVTPSTSAKFVIENDDDKIIMRGSSATAVYNYNITANTWDTSTWAAAGNACGSGVVLEQSYGIVRDPSLNARQSNLFCIRGSGVSNIDVLDIAGGSTGVWSASIVYGNAALSFTTGTCGAYDSATSGGKYLHLNVSGTQRHAKLDMRNRVLDVQTYLRYPQGSSVPGPKLGFGLFVDGATKLGIVYEVTQSQAQTFSLAIQR